MIRLAAALRGRRRRASEKHPTRPRPEPAGAKPLQRIRRPGGSSDWRPFGGRLWDPLADPNRPLDGEPAFHGRLYPLYFTCSVAASYGPGGAGDRSRVRAVHVDLRARIVSAYPIGLGEPVVEEMLDAMHPVPSYAWGLVFAREAATSIEHGLSLVGDAPVGTKVTLSPEGRRFPRRDSPALDRVESALTRYGGLVVEEVRGMPLTVLMESPPGGCPWPDDAGRFYLEQGIAAPDGFVGIEAQAIIIPTTR